MNKDILSLIVDNLGMTGFIFFLFFLLISLYVKAKSERRILLYTFISIAILSVVSGIYLEIKRESNNENKIDPEQVKKTESETTSDLLQDFENVDVKGSVTQQSSGGGKNTVEAQQKFNGVTVGGDIIQNTVNSKE